MSGAILQWNTVLFYVFALTDSENWIKPCVAHERGTRTYEDWRPVPHNARHCRAEVLLLWSFATCSLQIMRHMYTWHDQGGILDWAGIVAYVKPTRIYKLTILLCRSEDILTLLLSTPHFSTVPSRGIRLIPKGWRRFRSGLLCTSRISRGMGS